MHSQAALAFDIMLFFYFHAFLHRRAFCFYLLSNSLFLSATHAFSVIYYICLLYASSYPLCYSMYPPPTEPNRYRIVESSSCLRVLKGLARFERLVFIGCYLYYIYHTHTYTHTCTHNMDTLWKFPPLHCKPARMHQTRAALRYAAALLSLALVYANCFYNLLR